MDPAIEYVQEQCVPLVFVLGSKTSFDGLVKLYSEQPVGKKMK
jgi:hypothetical protein